MRALRHEREINETRTEYAKAAERFGRALADWQRAAVPVEPDDGKLVPHWTIGQREASWRAADAFADLVSSHRAWERLVERLGHQR